MPRIQTIRRWVPADLERIGWVHSRSRQEAYAALVVEDDGVVVGFALAQLDAESGAELNAIHVLPEQQGSGAGQALMDAVVDAFGQWAVAKAHLHVLEGNERAQACYRRNGWRLCGPAGSHEIGGAAVPILEYRRVLA